MGSRRQKKKRMRGTGEEPPASQSLNGGAELTSGSGSKAEIATVETGSVETATVKAVAFATIPVGKTEERTAISERLELDSFELEREGEGQPTDGGHAAQLECFDRTPLDRVSEMITLREGSSADGGQAVLDGSGPEGVLELETEDGLKPVQSPQDFEPKTILAEVAELADSKGQSGYSEKSVSVRTENNPGRDYSVEPIGARIKVIGLGGAGTNAVNNMIRSGLQGVDFICANTDIQSLRSALAETKIQIGTGCTKGLGAGANPEVGEAAARESIDEIRGHLEGADMVFVTAGMGGGTGTGAAQVVAQVAKELGALTVGVVTKPFMFEGRRRMQNADVGMQGLKREVDTLITIPNQRLLSVSGRNTTLLDCFRKADDILFQAVKGISDLILFEGLVNVDFADVKAVMSEMGMAMMGSGEGTSENRAVEAAEKAISSPLLEDVSIAGARGVLINVTAGPDVTLQEINEAAELIHQEAHEDANIIWGMVIDPEMQDRVRVTVIATGFGDAERKLTVPNALQSGLGASGFGVSGSFGSTASDSDKKLDIPTFTRNKQSPLDTSKLIAKKAVAPEEEDKFEIPTFLRRQVD